MEAWQARLEAEFEALNAKARSSIDNQRQLLRNQLDLGRCGKCDVRTLLGDMVAFECLGTEGSTGHLLCVDCLADKQERQKGWVDRHPEFAASFPVLRDIVLCHECHRPHVVKANVEFCCGFDQKMRLRGRQHYDVDKDATENLVGSFEVRVRFQNQRRYVFSRFSDSRLISALDKCSALSDSEGRPVTERDFALNADQVWLEEWSCDSTSDWCDVLGWQYAFTWPKSFLSGAGWSNTASWATFVRCRRMLRTAITVGPALTYDHRILAERKDKSAVAKSVAKSVADNNGAAPAEVAVTVAPSAAAAAAAAGTVREANDGRVTGAGETTAAPSRSFSTTEEEDEEEEEESREETKGDNGKGEKEKKKGENSREEKKSEESKTLITEEEVEEEAVQESTSHVAFQRRPERGFPGRGLLVCPVVLSHRTHTVEDIDIDPSTPLRRKASTTMGGGSRGSYVETLGGGARTPPPPAERSSDLVH